jgi:poly(3-hydroxyalkanoate) depolymerase
MTRDPRERASGFDPAAEGERVLTLAGGLPAPGPVAPTKRTGVVQAGNQRLRVSLVGEGRGRPLLLVNGIGATGDLWDDFRAHVADRETIAFDAPGVGGSPAPLYPFRINWFARRLADLVESLGHDQVDVLGLSWGGALAQELAIRHPEKVRRLVLAATTPGVVSLPGRPGALWILMTPRRYYDGDYLNRVAPTLYGGAVRHYPEMMVRHGQVRATRPPTPWGYLGQLMALRRWTSLPRLPRMRMRTLVLAGDDDPIIPLTNGRMIASLAPNARLHVVEGGGHLFLFTRPAEMADRIRTFLDED